MREGTERPCHGTRGVALRRVALLAAATGLLLLGCDSDPNPIKTPAPSVTYGQVSAGLCERVNVNQVAERFGLRLRPMEDLSEHFNSLGSYVYLSCEFRAFDDGDRFRTQLGEFDPVGSVSLRTYPDQGAAKGGYESAAHALRSSERLRQGVSIQEVSGWWDDGVSSQMVTPIDPERYPRLKGLDAAELGVAYELRHGNLLVTTHLNTQAATPEIEQVLALLRDLANALTNEAVSHLTKTGPD